MCLWEATLSEYAGKHQRTVKTALNTFIKKYPSVLVDFVLLIFTLFFFLKVLFSIFVICHCYGVTVYLQLFFFCVFLPSSFFFKCVLKYTPSLFFCRFLVFVVLPSSLKRR